MKILLYIMLLILCMFLISEAAGRQPAQVHVAQGKVVRVIDGDTLDLQTTTGTLRVRLLGVDAPEHDQPYGTSATLHLTELVRGQYVEVQWKAWSYGRAVGNVWKHDQSINLRQVEDGCAWWVRVFAPRDKQLESAMTRARLERRGLWGLQDPIEPYAWRTRKENDRGDAAAPVPTPKRVVVHRRTVHTTTTLPTVPMVGLPK